MLNLFTHLEINTRYLWPLTITKGCNKLLLHAILMRQMQSVGKALSNSPQCDYYFVKKKKKFSPSSWFQAWLQTWLESLIEHTLKPETSAKITEPSCRFFSCPLFGFLNWGGFPHLFVVVLKRTGPVCPWEARLSKANMHWEVLIKVHATFPTLSAPAR